MSGSGGYHQFRCKYFLTHNCNNWVWVANTACASCMVSENPSRAGENHLAADHRTQAEGRDAGEPAGAEPGGGFCREMFVRQVQDGTSQYTLMELVATEECGKYWALREKAMQPPAPPVIVTSDVPGVVRSTAGVKTYWLQKY